MTSAVFPRSPTAVAQYAALSEEALREIRSVQAAYAARGRDVHVATLTRVSARIERGRRAARTHELERLPRFSPENLTVSMEENVSFLVVRAEEPSALARFMLEHTRPFYVRDAAG